MKERGAMKAKLASTALAVVLAAGMCPPAALAAEGALTAGSPLRGKGADVGFTAEDLDLAGRPRLRDGKLDLGCYECWLNPGGMFMSVR